MVRVSSPGQAADDRQGLQRQRNDIAAFCSIYRLKVVCEFEIVMSGADVQRTRAFSEMLAMLRKPKIDGIVVASLDRFFRVTKLSVLAAFKEFEDSGKPLFCDLGEMDLNNPNHQMMISIKAQMAGMERSLFSGRFVFRGLVVCGNLFTEAYERLPSIPPAVEHKCCIGTSFQSRSPAHPLVERYRE